MDFNESAGVAAGVGLFAAAAWKIFLRLRSDGRNDREGTRSDRASERQHEGYDAIIEQLRTEVKRLGVAVDQMSGRLRREQEARYAAERTAAELRHRVLELEAEVRALKGRQQ